MKNNLNKKEYHINYSTIILSTIISVLILVGFSAGFGFIDFPKLKTFFVGEEEVIEEPGNKNIILTESSIREDTMNINDAYDVGLVKARSWRSDAELSFIDTAVEKKDNGFKIWKLIFVSKNYPNKGFTVEVADYKIISSNEIDYTGIGAKLPSEIISQEEAIERVRKIKEYENAEIFGVEAIYGTGQEVWYWGVKTSKGIVSIEAKK